MKGKSAKQKGARFEYHLRDFFQKNIDIKARKNMMSGAGYDRGDLLIPSLNAVIEAKNQKNISLIEWWEQARSEALHDQIPMLAIRNPRKPEFEETLLVLSLESFAEFMKKQIITTIEKPTENKALAWSVAGLKVACQKVLKEIG